MLVGGWLLLLFGGLFILGSAVGSFLNVCIYRLPRGKNLFWPSSRCGTCFTPIRSTDNLPLLAYWRLGGRCRACGATFSVRYFLVELIVAIVFVGLYALEVGWNLHGLVAWSPNGFWYLSWGGFPPGSWLFFTAHVVLASLLVVALGCLLDGEDVPRGLVVCGAVLGLAWAILNPWPWPSDRYIPGPDPVVDGGTHEATWRGPMPERESWATAKVSPRPGFVPWPVWGPLPASMPPGSLTLGLLTGLAGVVLPATFVRLIDRGQRGMGPATPALLAMTGGFLGWQSLVVALTLTVVLTLVIHLLPVSGRREWTGREFAEILVASLVVAWLGWAWLGPMVRPILFSGVGLMAWLGMLAVGTPRALPWAGGTSLSGSKTEGGVSGLKGPARAVQPSIR